MSSYAHELFQQQFSMQSQEYCLLIQYGNGECEQAMVPLADQSTSGDMLLQTRHAISSSPMFWIPIKSWAVR